MAEKGIEMSEQKFVEKYWRKAKPEDSVKDPPMVARFRDKPRDDWWIDELHMWDRTMEEPWIDSQGSGWSEVEVYDAPELVPSYVPFTWDDLEEFFGRTVVIDTEDVKRQFVVQDCCKSTISELIIEEWASDWLLKNAKFKDTGKPFGREVFNEVG